MIIDTHAHVFPDAIAVKAAQSTSRFYNIPMCSADGKLETLLAAERAAGVDKAVVCSAATTAEQTTHVNDFIARVVATEPGTLYGLGAMHQDYPDMPGEARRMAGLGLRGVKIHPDIQGVAINDRRFDPLYAALSDLGLPLLAHTGDVRYAYSNPPQVIDVLKRFPALRLICAHMGCWSDWLHGAEHLADYENAYVDCSSSFYALTDADARALIRHYGADKVLFGSDFPMWLPVDELARLRGLGLAASELEQILHRNAERLFGIPAEDSAAASA